MSMLMALTAMYRCTNSVIGTALVAATVGVRQGSPTSCILFVLYVNVMIRLLKQGCPIDGFLSWCSLLAFILSICFTTEPSGLAICSLLIRSSLFFGIYLTLADINFFLLLLLTLMSWRYTFDNVVSLRDLLNGSCSVSREEQ